MTAQWVRVLFSKTKVWIQGKTHDLHDKKERLFIVAFWAPKFQAHMYLQPSQHIDTASTEIHVTIIVGYNLVLVICSPAWTTFAHVLA